MMPDTDGKYIAVVDYGMGNLFSIMNICRHVGMKAVKTSEKSVIEDSSAVILPGVGAFEDAMRALKRLDLTGVLIDAANNGKPFLGICLGMQLLMSESEEFGINKGLNVIGGRVTKFPNFNDKNDKVRVPHIGWNRIFLAQNSVAEDPVLCNIHDGELMYFVHSFFAVPQEERSVITYTDYCGIRYCSGIRKDNLVAFQFHPEKSGPSGLRVFRNFKEIIYKENGNG
ncbi:MAG: imidazole glycerol phosphate synthase subunit HisH [Candidatus Omnitrophica bacterium]|nr:imidazole glycerol phosphate synthase subunit HisH [Candidatus Omnitrophota bacterium]